MVVSVLLFVECPNFPFPSLWDRHNSERRTDVVRGIVGLGSDKTVNQRNGFPNRRVGLVAKHLCRSRGMSQKDREACAIGNPEIPNDPLKSHDKRRKRRYQLATGFEGSVKTVDFELQADDDWIVRQIIAANYELRHDVIWKFLPQIIPFVGVQPVVYKNLVKPREFGGDLSFEHGSEIVNRCFGSNSRLCNGDDVRKAEMNLAVIKESEVDAFGSLSSDTEPPINKKSFGSGSCWPAGLMTPSINSYDFGVRAEYYAIAGNNHYDCRGLTNCLSQTYTNGNSARGFIEF